MSGTSQSQSLIPSITDERLHELLDRIRPVIRRGKSLWYIRPVDPRKVDFTRNPRWDSPATGLRKITTIKTLHSFTSALNFHPTIAEVLAQLPDEHIESASAFTTTRRNDTQREWSARAQEVLPMGYHLATTTLYTWQS